MNGKETEWKPEELPSSETDEPTINTAFPPKPAFENAWQESLYEQNKAIFNTLNLLRQDILQNTRTKLRKIERVVQPTQMEVVTNRFPQDLRGMLTFDGTQPEQGIIIRPRQYLGKENFGKIARIVTQLGGEYVSAGKNSHFKVAPT